MTKINIGSVFGKPVEIDDNNTIKHNRVKHSILDKPVLDKIKLLEDITLPNKKNAVMDKRDLDLLQQYNLLDGEIHYYDTNELYSICNKLYIDIVGTYHTVLSETYIRELMDNFEIELTRYLENGENNLHMYMEQLREWRGTSEPIVAGLTDYTSQDKLSDEHVVVDSINSRPVYTSKFKIIEFIESMVNRLRLVTYQKELYSALLSGISSKIDMIDTYERLLVRYNRMNHANEIAENNFISDTQGKLKELIGEMSPTNVIVEGKNLESIIDESDILVADITRNTERYSRSVSNYYSGLVDYLDDLSKST